MLLPSLPPSIPSGWLSHSRHYMAALLHWRRVVGIPGPALVTVRQHKWGLCGPWVRLQYSKSQEVRMVEGGVRRWEGLGSDGKTGSGEGGLGVGRVEMLTRLQLFSQTGEEQPWHYDTEDAWKHAHTIHYAMCALSPPSLQHSEGRKWKKIELAIGSQQLEAALTLFSKCWTCVEAQVSVAVAVSQLECVFPRNNLCVSSPLSEIERALCSCSQVKVTGLLLSWKPNRL